MWSGFCSSNSQDLVMNHHKGKIKTRKLAEITSNSWVSQKRAVDLARKSNTKVATKHRWHFRGEQVRAITCDENDHMAQKHHAMERAEEFRALLGNECPNFAHSMLPSQVSGGFWMGLPKKFCQLHLPRYDIIVNLVDEEGKCYEIVYLARRNGLSGGWKRFSIAHALLEGDALVFQLVEPSQFKVFIVRAYSLCDVDGVLCLMALTNAKQVAEFGHEGKESGKSLPLAVRNVHKGSWTGASSDSGHLVFISDQSSVIISPFSLEEGENFSISSPMTSVES